MFYSYKPYLQIALTRECIVTFDKNGVYIAKTPEEEKLIAEAEQRKKARAEEEGRRKEIHDFCSSLRMSDEVYR